MEMKVSVFGTRGFPLVQGGVEKHCECLYPLMDASCRLTVFRRRPYVRSSGAICDHIRFVDLPSTRIKGWETACHSLLCTVYSLFRRPQVAHIHNIGPALFSPLLKLAGIKVLLTYHSANYEHKRWNFIARKILKLSEKIALRTADAIIFISEAQRQKFGPRIQAKSCHIPNGIQTPQPTDATDFLQAQGVRKGRYILAVGRITPEKGFDCLINAFKDAALENCQLVIAGGVEGESSYFTALQKSASDCGNIIFTGYVYGSQLAQLYSHAALFVLPSYSEGMPLVLLEAMSYGLAMLASDIPANRAVNLPPQVYFATGDEKELADRLRQRMCNPAPEKIRYRIPDAYNWKQIARQTVEIYGALCAGRYG
ncbi:MAG: glycosyltransferase family 4 protein [Tannerella sp.]|jgi:glycosyltransferase involved in cell wall biosynthesis|nr:glycosyltransferase family 4 protein [Tannerella sp.]